MKQANQDRGTLLLALVAGLSINGTFAALFSSIVPFSVFPIISLVLTVYCLHQRYLNRTMPVGLPGLAAACFILGVLLYSTVVRAEYPDIGSNFFPAVLSVIMVFWIGAKMRNRKQELLSNRDYADAGASGMGFTSRSVIRRTPYGACRGTYQQSQTFDLVRLA